MEYKSIAIDGPSGAGKSTMAKRLATALGYLYVDTGAIYRTLGLFALKRGVDPGCEREVLPLLPQAKIKMAYGEDGFQHMYLGGEDVTDEIRRDRKSVCRERVSS